MPKNSYGKVVLDLRKYVPKWRDKSPNKQQSAKATMHLKSQLDTRYPTANRNPSKGTKMAKELRPATNGFPQRQWMHDGKTIQNYPNTLINNK